MSKNLERESNVPKAGYGNELMAQSKSGRASYLSA